ncbi:hypothetical protein F2Q69_00018525 [Brassica cretica]|uniref:Uncharacterized protein n=1 Tax=Brassica cretica TaxID=69181 RepID=A0A8S9QRY5_BRACR|nr:hypothetical protein F2Q69_00018525 [Brassica cretica]
MQLSEQIWSNLTKKLLGTQFTHRWDKVLALLQVNIRDKTTTFLFGPASLGAAPVWPLSDPAPTFSPPSSEEARAPLTVSMVKAPPQPRSRPPPDPSPCKLSVPLETRTPSEPPEPPNPPDAVFTLFFLPFVDESLYTSPHMVTKVVDLESSVSDMEDENIGGVFLGVSKRRVLSRVVRSPDSGVLNPSLPSHDAADPSSPSFRLVKTGSGLCSVFKNQLLRVFTSCSLLYIGRSKSSTSGSPTYWLRRETNDCMLRFVLSRSVWLQPYHACGSYLSLTSAFTTQRINFAALSFAISVLQGWSPCLNSATAYPSDIIKLLPLGIEVKCSRTGVQGRFIFHQDTLVEFSNQDSIHSSSSSSRSRTTSNTRGSTRQDSVSSMLVAEALTLQSGLLTAENLEIPTLKMLSGNSTLVRAINNDNQNKEIYGIVKDNQHLFCFCRYLVSSYLSSFTTQRINFAALSFAISVLQGWSPCLNSATAYPSDIIKLLPLGIEVKCSRTGVQGRFIFHQDTLVEFSNQDSIHSSSSSSRSRTTSNTRGSTRQDSVSSMLVAEALTLQSGLLTAENLEIPTLKMLSGNSTLVRAINNDNQNKEIYGIVKDNQHLFCFCRYLVSSYLSSM